MIRLSIIIPAYNPEPYLSELLRGIAPQMTKEVEVLVIDDGSRTPVKAPEWARVIKKKNGGCASARNMGIDKARGEYLAFVDSDDVLSENFVSKILAKTKSDKPDVIEVSWKSLNGSQHDQKLNSEADRLTNASVWCRILKKSFVGDRRFNEKKDSTEDEDFTRHLGLRDEVPTFSRAIIPDYMYFYRDDVDNSKIKRYKKGLMNTKRITYYYQHVTKDRQDIFEAIKKDDETNEVFLITEQCDIPELSRYCQIWKPVHTWTHYLKGETYHNIEIIKPPIRTQVVIYRKGMYVIGGLMTFTMNFVDYMADKYDITIVCDKMDQRRLRYFIPKVRVLVNMPDTEVVCDTMIVLSILDPLPPNVHAKKILRMCHTCRTNPQWKIPDDYDQLAFVSDTSKKSFDFKDGDIIHNLIKDRSRQMLMLVSATRLPAPDKGDLETRFYKLAKMLNDADIPFLWFNFADGKLKDPPKNFYNMGMSMDMQTYIKKADYVVALSDSEAWSYTVLESLTLGTPLICTPFPSAFEMGVEDGVNAHVVPFDMDFDVHKLLDIPAFEYKYDNEAIVKQWVKALGKTVPRRDYVPDKMVLVEVMREFYDMQLGCNKTKGEVYQMTQARAEHIVSDQPTLIRIIGGINERTDTIGK